MKKLSNTQINILQTAAERHDGSILPLPNTVNVNAGIQPRVIKGLANRSLIDEKGELFVININGYKAAGIEPPQEATSQESTHSTTKTETETETETSHNDQSKRPRKDTKLDTVYQMLLQDNGTNIAEIAEATGWLHHTVRGTLSGIFKKKYGLHIKEVKTDEKHKRYKIALNASNTQTSDTSIEK